MSSYISFGQYVMHIVLHNRLHIRYERKILIVDLRGRDFVANRVVDLRIIP